ncbi:MAG TPA: DNA polymerase II, partial [Verrucomicrobiales bacterium]|nr:DNA polymerase II [Verrucomicrobiales bacterium]
MKTATALEAKAPLIDTSKMSAGQKAALEMAEAARDERHNTGLAAGIFFGGPDFSKVMPFPRQSDEDKDQGDAFLGRLRAV